MSKTAIRVTNLSKRYRISLGQQKRGYRTLRESISEKISSIAHRERVEKQDFWALKDINFEVKKGESLGIIGRNGAGKSTLLKILSRITKPTEGRAVLDGRVGSLLEVGTGFHAELTGRENVYLNGAILGMHRSEIERKFDEIIAFSEIEQFLDTPVKRYSSGMYVRLAFAVAAHLEPEILIVDEVLAVGDTEFQKKCLGKMGDVTSEGRTVLFVSHNMGAVKRLCSRAILLEKGSIQMIGETEKVIDYYLDTSSIGSNTTVDLPNSSGLGRTFGRGLTLTIKDESGNPRNVFKIGEKWIVRLEFEVYKNIENFTASIGISTLEATTIITYWSHPSTVNKGRYFVEFLCDIPLKASHLAIHVDLHEQGRPFYHTQGVGSVEVTSVSNIDQPLKVIGRGILIGNQNSEIYPL